MAYAVTGLFPIGGQSKKGSNSRPMWSTHQLMLSPLLTQRDTSMMRLTF